VTNDPSRLFASLFSHDLMLRIPGLALLVQQQQKRATALTPKTSAPIISLVHCGQSGTITPY
jgi:hypothetical protein